MNWLSFARSRSSDFVQALTTELDRVGIATHYLLLLLANLLVVTVYFLLSLHLSFAMTGLVLFCGFGLLTLLSGKTLAARSHGQKLSLASKALYAAAIEHLSGMKTAKSYSAEDRNSQIFSTLADGVARTYIGAVRNRSEAKSWFDVGAVLILSLILYISLEILRLQTAEVLLLVFLYARAMPKLSSIQQSYQQVVNNVPAFTAVAEMQARCEAAVEQRPERLEEVRLQRDVHLKQVSFRYEGDDSRLVLSNLDLLIRRGETTAIMGPSGAGKSTVADLILGLLQPTRGDVLINGNRLTSSRIRSWRAQIGYVGQETFLLHDTVKSNLLWANPHAGDDDIDQALRLAAAHQFVSRLPQGIQTVVGDRGVRLSGGERQRLALARALLRKPSLLILDEATSSLDSENERRIQAAIENLTGELTILIISHRLSTVRDADVIHVIDDGHLVESGDWDTLVQRQSGRFAAYCRAQGLEYA